MSAIYNVYNSLDYLIFSPLKLTPRPEASRNTWVILARCCNNVDNDFSRLFRIHKIYSHGSKHTRLSESVGVAFYRG